MEFLDRISEQKIFKKITQSKSSEFVIVYGRRRVGKSALLKHVTNTSGIYHLADLNDKRIQIQQLANTIAEKVADFNSVIYPSWYALLIALNARLTKKITLVIDEFPFLVNTSTELPSEIQKLIDLKKLDKITLILCGSSQQMMRDLFLGTTAPLYGRTTGVFNIKEMKVGWLKQYLKCRAEQAIMEFATWGGIPRYWEVRKKYTTLEQAQLQAIMHKDGLLYEEPMRLFMDDLRSAVQAFSLVNLIGNGCHKLSEIASVLEKPATNFSRPLAQLIEMGYVRKEIPFGEKEDKSKKSLYWLDDSFMNFYMQMVSPNKSIIELGLEKELKNKLKLKLPQLYAQVFEELVRESVNSFDYFGKKWGKAYRYWGKPDGKTETEIDLMCLSHDGKSILIGEVKWSDTVDVKTVHAQLAAKIALFPIDKKLKVYTAVWVKNKAKVKNASASTFDCNEVVNKAL
jgi:uncharacterized protein